MPLTFVLIFQKEWTLYLFGYILATLIGFSDTIDGYLARRYGEVTRFGQFLDPLADKIFVVTLLLYFINLNMIPAWLVVLVMLREFAVTDFRILAAEGQTDIRVNVLGKRKALFQYVLLFHLGYLRLMDLMHIPVVGASHTLAYLTLAFLIGTVVFFTAFSMLYYLWRNWKVLFGRVQT